MWHGVLGGGVARFPSARSGDLRDGSGGRMLAAEMRINIYLDAGKSAGGDRPSVLLPPVAHGPPPQLVPVSVRLVASLLDLLCEPR